MTLAAIFDLDGTLVTFRFDVKGTREALLHELEVRGLSTSGLGQGTPTQKILEAARTQIPGESDSEFEELRRVSYDILDKFELASAPTTEPLPGAMETLDLLKSEKIRLAVLTNSGRKAAMEILGRSGLTGFFEFVLTRDETETMKPRPEGIDKAISLLCLPKSDVWYVGDSPYDIMAAKQAGIKVASVATGNYTPKRLKEEGADRVMLSITELPQVLGL